MKDKAGLLGSGEDPSKAWGIKGAVLIGLLVQNASHALLTRYSQGILKETYSSTSILICAEIIKTVFSAYLSVNDKAETDAVGQGMSKLIWLASHGSKMITLVILYGSANILAYFALARVDASVYSVLLQLKIVTTAGFAVMILGRNISSTKWRALVLLVFGCVLVASPAFNRCALGESSSDIDAEDEQTTVLDSLSGMVSVLVMVMTSGYSAVYFEKMLKSSSEKITIWERNFQLALYSTILLVMWFMVEMFNNDVLLHEVHYEFFAGWTFWAVIITLIQAAGGLLVAATLKYADAVLKTLATSGSIVCSAVLGWCFLGGKLDIFVAIGCLATILGIFNYVLDAS